MNLREIDLRKLNSMTKYPSIPTYHVIDDKTHLLREEVGVAFGAAEPVWFTEKIDGTNARMIFAPRVSRGDARWLLGSRDELLCAEHDLIGNPSQGIVAALRPIATECASRLASEQNARGHILVIYGEVYGGKINAAKNYTKSGATGFCCFDVATYDHDTWSEMLRARSVEQVAAWRESGGQTFWNHELVSRFRADCELFEFVPEVAMGTMTTTSLQATRALLEDMGTFTVAHLDPADGTPGSGGLREGVVVRNADRSKIAKLRFEDYSRAMKGRK